MEWEYVWTNAYDGFDRTGTGLSAEPFQGVLIAKDNIHTFHIECTILDLSIKVYNYIFILFSLINHSLDFIIY
jgi:hypothetical protein